MDNDNNQHNDYSNNDDLIDELSIINKTPNTNKIKKRKHIRKVSTKTVNFILLFIKSIFLFIYYTGLKIESCVSYANREGIRRIIDYISTISIFIFKIFNKGFFYIFKQIKVASRYWIPACSILLVALFIASSTTYAFALKVTIDDEVVGYVSEQSKFVIAKEKVENDISDKLNDRYAFDRVPTFSFSIVKRDSLTGSEQVYSNLYKKAEESLGQTYGIFVDGKLIAAYPKEGPIIDLLDELKQPYQTNSKYETIEFTNKVDIVRNMYSRSIVKTIDEIKAMFTMPKDQEIYVIQRGDTISEISNKFDISPKQIELINKDEDLSKIYKGQKINVSKPLVDLGFKVIRTINYNTNIAYETVSTYAADLFEGTTKVKASGSKGLNEIKAKVTLINGVEKNREIIETKLIKKPVIRQLLVGTKKIAPSGKFIWPVPNSHRISSGYGYRGREFHAAIDIAAPYGTPIVATDAGTIEVASWNRGGGGNEIYINHGNGVRSRYCHLGSYAVKVGQKVYQGQVIGYVGSTGRSTGTHCHFEIIINGTRANPLKYVK